MDYENDVFDENFTNILLDEDNLWLIDKDTRKRDSAYFIWLWSDKTAAKIS